MRARWCQPRDGTPPSCEPAVRLAHILHAMPNGALGFLLVALVGRRFGKSMLETRGSRWAV